MSVVSIIIPVYNCEKFIEKCIRSILAQTYQEIEVIIINDGSRDRSNEIISQIQDMRIKYISQQNAGVAEARNRAVSVATGKYLLFVDGDDYIAVDYVERLVDCAEKQQSELVIGGYTQVDLKTGKEKRTIPYNYERMRHEEWAYRISAVWCRLYLREFWDKYELRFIQENNARAEDVPISIFANAMAQRVCTVPCAGYYYVQHEASAMNQKGKKVKFSFPYKGFSEMYERLKVMELANSESFFYFGILKFLAQFEVVLYRHAGREEKNRFHDFIYNILWQDAKKILTSWKQLKKGINLSFLYKIAIDVFIIKNSKTFRRSK